MLLKYFYDKLLAQASYMIGCAKTGEALIIDPSRDITSYLKAAQEENLTIVHIAETHIHADFVSGSRELAQATGAAIYLSAEGGVDWQYAYADHPSVKLVKHGDSFKVGNIVVEVIHTPGHTPEHICFIVTDTAGANRPMGIFSGDFVFVGDVGRPDLLEEAAGVVGSREVGARQQFHSVKAIKKQPDYWQVWPGHGAGSACGKALGAIPSSALGYEKLFNPAFQFTDEELFMDWLLEGQPEVPHYFAQMKHINRQGPALLSDLPASRRMNRVEMEAILSEGGLVFDLRDSDAFVQAHLPNSISVPSSSNSFLTYIGWYVDYQQPTYIIVPDEERAHEMIAALQHIGIDHVPGWAAPDIFNADDPSLPTITTDELIAMPDALILDVRGKQEYEQQHIENARHIMLGKLPQQLDSLPKNKTIVTHCVSGYRSQIAASFLRKAGFKKVFSLRESMDEWSKKMPTVSSETTTTR